MKTKRPEEYRELGIMIFKTNSETDLLLPVSPLVRQYARAMFIEYASDQF